MEIKKECLDNSREICQSMNVENFIPYMPSNGTEGNYFEALWCERCAKNYNCDIIIQAYCGDQPPEWIYFDNKPMCIKWEKFNEAPI